MPNQILDDTKRRLLGILQTGFPLTVRPFDVLGGELGVPSEDVLRQVSELTESGVVRQIGPVMDARKLGYQSTLVAMTISPLNLEKAVGIIRENPGISHAYEREHPLNVWVTLAVPSNIGVDNAVEQLAKETGAETICSLPALKVFKLRAIFGDDAEIVPAPETGNQAIIELTAAETKVVNVIQQSIEIVPEPFNKPAVQAGMSQVEFLAISNSLLERGIIRRYGAAINHRQAGFTANAMVGWVAGGEVADIAGQKMASHREVSHCYIRKTCSAWRYNLFSMVHGGTEEECRAIVNEMSRETGLVDYALLISTREFKKARIKYPV